jgi:hypothetical protein
MGNLTHTDFDKIFIYDSKGARYFFSKMGNHIQA